jgi:hypothetical protein
MLLFIGLRNIGNRAMDVVLFLIWLLQHLSCVVLSVGKWKISSFYVRTKLIDVGILSA